MLYISLGNHGRRRANGDSIANSGQPFLWVVRPRSVDRVQWERFTEIAGERGHIVRWAPAETGSGTFCNWWIWSHCGRNSTLESICEDVPIICTPRFGDERVNARYLTDKWKVGLQIENVKDREKYKKEKKWGKECWRWKQMRKLLWRKVVHHKSPCLTWQSPFSRSHSSKDNKTRCLHHLVETLTTLIHSDCTETWSDHGFCCCYDPHDYTHLQA